MCLGIPGKLIELYRQDELPMGKVEFGGITKDVCLVYTPEAKVGQYVLVHVGFALSQIDVPQRFHAMNAGFLQDVVGLDLATQTRTESPLDESQQLRPLQIDILGQRVVILVSNLLHQRINIG